MLCKFHEVSKRGGEGGVRSLGSNIITNFLSDKSEIRIRLTSF